MLLFGRSSSGRGVPARTEKVRSGGCYIFFAKKKQKRMPLTSQTRPVQTLYTTKNMKLIYADE